MITHRFTWLSAGLLLSRVCSMPTNCRLKRRLVETCHNLLMSMGDRFPLRCIDDRVLVPFPKTAFEYNTSHQAGAIKQSVYVTLKFIYSVFDNDEVPEQWDGQQFEDFQNIMFRQIEESECVRTKSNCRPNIKDYPFRLPFQIIQQNSCFRSQFQFRINKKIESLEDFYNRESVLREYFGKLTTVLKEKDFQYCAWEFVRNEIQHVLLFILKTDLDGLFFGRG
ncbi:interferon alpha-4-like isoform X1 [Brachyhypopomus gauderio]|uniref:interferon alpha-4-like isoform X1 n=1 Tax=Brachyhypopomus gauderio TaxID=698409 RepID=UPI0040436439